MSLEEWQAWASEQHVSEWVNGEVFVMPSPNVLHQTIVLIFSQLLGFFLAAFPRGRVLVAPLDMRLERVGSIRVPDIVYLDAANFERLSSKRLEGPADLIVEVISEESAARDRNDKFYEYQAAGIREYWLIDPREGKRRIDLYTLGSDGRYQSVLAEQGNIYRSQVVAGFWLREEWLWQDLPNMLAMVSEVLGPERMLAALEQAQPKQS
jgi:Uma2 family endonuclease